MCLAEELSPRYPENGARTLTDAVLGGNQFTDPAIDVVTARFFHSSSSWIWLPRRLQIEVSADDETFIPSPARPTMSTIGPVAVLLVSSSPRFKVNPVADYTLRRMTRQSVEDVQTRRMS